MRYVALLSVFFLVSACLVPKKELLFAQAHVVRLQSDSLAFEQRLLTAQGTMGNTQGQLQELQKSYEESFQPTRQRRGHPAGRFTRTR